MSIVFARRRAQAARAQAEAAQASPPAESDARVQAAAPEGAVIHMVDLPPLEPDELKTLALSALPAVGGDLQLDADLQLDEGLSSRPLLLQRVPQPPLQVLLHRPVLPLALRLLLSQPPHLLPQVAHLFVVDLK